MLAIWTLPFDAGAESIVVVVDVAEIMVPFFRGIRGVRTDSDAVLLAPSKGSTSRYLYDPRKNTSLGM